MNFGDIAKSYLTYLQTHYGSNVAVVFDGYPSDVNGKSTKSAERIRRANLHSSHEIIFNEATCPEISQEQFLENEKNKVRFIAFLKKFLQKSNVKVKQVVEDADVLIVETAVSVKSTNGVSSSERELVLPKMWKREDAKCVILHNVI
ncbi:hypothetical protein AVEN_252863-1 [Araneus ventricosus]|uniref:Uncharacterized protein n=1 Tax=Araneus ventricosus TaxID=182803 RepID=A0A4Y2U5X6_ARAVE|nr:hypothetical protein AVEN_252863-1 [Araneus ventricosus]